MPPPPPPPARYKVDPVQVFVIPIPPLPPGLDPDPLTPAAPAPPPPAPVQVTDVDPPLNPSTLSANGSVVVEVVTDPLLVIVAAKVLLSTIVASCNVNKLVCVPVIADMFVPLLCVAVSGPAGTIKLLV